jgi:hypothetical protein
VAGGKRNQVREPFHHDGIAVVNEAAHGLLHGEKFGHDWHSSENERF